MNPRLKPLAFAIAVIPATIAHAAEQLAMLDTVTITATRFSEPDPAIAANVTVITQTDIRNSGAQNVPEVLKYKAGLQIRPLYGSLAADTGIDMRGFGEGGSQRTLVLLNGMRLNPLDLSNTDWGLVPLDNIDRIEIISGSGSVLYGDNAVGGVINIVTGKLPDGGSIQAGLGSNDSRQLAANFSKQLGPVDLSLSASHQATDGWRNNNIQERNNVAGRIGMHFDRGEAFVDLGWSKLEIGLPGSLTRSQYATNPRQAQTQDSTADRTAAYIRPGVTWELTDKLRFAAEVGYTSLENTSWISNWPSYDNRQTNTLSFTPRLQWQHGLASLPSTTTIGIDYYDGELTSDKALIPNGPITKTVRIDQTSQAIYLQNQTQLTSSLTLTAGARHQRVEQSAQDSTGLKLTNDHETNIGELGLSYKLAPGFRIFSRFGTTFRYANLDELTTFVGFVNKPVLPERGRFIDLGTQWSGSGYSLKLTAYSLNMTDEIAYNGLTYQNENLAKTRHQGIEVNGNYNLNRQWQLNAGLNLQKAEFREGTDQGKKIPLVPDVQATAGITFKPTTAWNLSLLGNYVGERYFGGDTSNQFEKLPAYTTGDFIAAWRQAAWTIRARILNLGDKKYAPLGFNYGYGESHYPADGRTFLVDVRYSF